VFFSIEISPLIAYEPTPDELASMPVARAVTVGADDRRPDAPAHWRYETAEWLATQLSTDLVELPGGHLGYLGDPRARSVRSGTDAGPESTRLTPVPDSSLPGSIDLTLGRIPERAQRDWT
jgi:hypothetical protein